MNKELIDRLRDNRVTGIDLSIAAVEAADTIEQLMCDTQEVNAARLYLRQQLAAAETRLKGVKQQRDVERVSYLNEFEKNKSLEQQLADSQKQVTLLRDVVGHVAGMRFSIVTTKMCEAALAKVRKP